MPNKRYKAKQIVTLLRQIEVGIAKGKTTPQACKEVEITVQTYYRWAGGPAFDLEFEGATSFEVGRVGFFSVSSSLAIRNSNQDPPLKSVKDGAPADPI